MGGAYKTILRVSLLLLNLQLIILELDSINGIYIIGFVFLNPLLFDKIYFSISSRWQNPRRYQNYRYSVHHLENWSIYSDRWVRVRDQAQRARPRPQVMFWLRFYIVVLIRNCFFSRSFTFHILFGFFSVQFHNSFQFQFFFNSFSILFVYFIVVIFWISSNFF